MQTQEGVWENEEVCEIQAATARVYTDLVSSLFGVEMGWRVGRLVEDKACAAIDAALPLKRPP